MGRRADAGARVGWVSDAEGVLISSDTRKKHSKVQITFTLAQSTQNGFN